VDRHVVHTDQEKIKSTGNINIFSRHGRKLFHVRPSCHTEKSNQKQDHQVSTTEGMIDMMTVVRDMTPTKTFPCAVLTPLRHRVSIHEHRRIEYRDAITVQILVLTLPVNVILTGIDLIIQSGTVTDNNTTS
jgi:hypothetical protein